MHIKIENGMTIISTGDSNGGTKNKHNHTGVSQYISSIGTIKYKAEIQVNRKKYYLGYRSTVEEAAALRKEAEKHVEAGTFHDWLNDMKTNTVYNQNGKKGLWKSQRADGSFKYIAKITYKQNTYQLGTRNTLEEAIALREEAEKQLSNGTFFEWLQEIRN